MDQDQQDKIEAAYLRGCRFVWGTVLAKALHNLGYDQPEYKKWHWITEREAAIAMLRVLCEEYGDNDWPDNLYLPDVIEKHLGNHLG